jgi:hypothetical protein
MARSYDPTFRGGMGVLTQARASLVDPIHLPAELEKAYLLAPAPASSEGIKSIRKCDLDPLCISFLPPIILLFIPASYIRTSYL